MGIGQAYLAQGQYSEAISYLSRALGKLKAVGDAHCEAECLWLLGRARCQTGALDESAKLLDRALAMIRLLRDRELELRILTDIARLEGARGNPSAARERALAARG